MYLLNKTDATVYEIFDITYDSSGYPQFLIYKDKQWMRLSAKHFTPNYTPVFHNGKDTFLVEGELLNEE